MTRRLARILAFAALAAGGLAAPALADLSQNLGALSGENAKGYLAPLATGLSGTLNSAIFQTGSIPKANVNFTLGVKLMGVTFGDDDKTFTPVDPAGYSGPDVSTVVGGTEAVAHTGPGGVTLNYPGGFDISNFVIAVPQLTVGSVRGTQAVVRWISLDLGDSDLGKLDLFGIGAQHSVSQYFQDLPVDLAAGFMYQSFKIGDDLLDTKALHFDVTGSRSFGAGMARIQPYASLGYDHLTANVSYVSDVDPGAAIDVDLDAQNNVHFGLGALLTLGFVKLHGEFDAGAATGAAIGLSFGR